MPAEVFGPDYSFLPDGDMLDFEEITRLCRLFAQSGVEKIRLTGGEPLLRPRLPELVTMLAEIGGVEDLTLTTNGLRLSDYANALRESGLQRVTISLNTLSKDIAKRLNGRGDSVERTLAGIAAAQDAGLGIKVNTVIRRGLNEREILPLAQRFRGTGITLRFIEFMDVGNHNDWDKQNVIGSDEILEILETECSLEAVAPAYIGEVAKRYRYTDGSGEIGLVTSITQPFCVDCSRARLTADGKLVTCLFAKEGHELRPLLRNGVDDDALLAHIRAIWGDRMDRYSEQRHNGLVDSNPETKVEMSYVGG